MKITGKLLFSFGVCGILFLLLVSGFAESTKKEGLCVFVPGWKTQDLDYSDELKKMLLTLEQREPDIQFSSHYFIWESTLSDDWNKYAVAVRNTKKAAGQLADFLRDLSPSVRENTVLIGHSLGCRVIFQAFQELEPEDLAVKRIIFFAAAVPDDGKGMENQQEGTGEPLLNLLKGTREPLLNFIHPQDGALMAASKFEAMAQNGDELKLDSMKAVWNLSEEVADTLLQPHSPMLGLGAAVKREHMKEILIARNERTDLSMARQVWEPFAYVQNHYLIHFLEAWEKSPDKSLVEDILVPQGTFNVKNRVMDKKYWWWILKEYEGWQLQKNIITGHARILDPERYRMAVGNVERMELVFERIKEQLQKGGDS